MTTTNGGSNHDYSIWYTLGYHEPPESVATGSPLETDAELLARAVLAGDLRAAYPLADEVVARAQAPDGFVPRSDLTQQLNELRERVIRLEQGPQQHYYLGKRCRVLFGVPHCASLVAKDGRVSHVLPDGRFAFLSDDGEVGYFSGDAIALLP